MLTEYNDYKWDIIVNKENIGFSLLYELEKPDHDLDEITRCICLMTENELNETIYYGSDSINLLTFAYYNKKMDVFDILIDDHNVDINQNMIINGKNQTIFTIVGDNSDIPTMEKILKRPDLDVNKILYQSTEDNKIWCYWSFYLCLTDDALKKMILSHPKLNLNIIMDRYNDFLSDSDHYYIEEDDLKSTIIQIIKGSQIDLNEQDESGETPLLKSIKYGMDFLLKEFLAQSKIIKNKENLFV